MPILTKEKEYVNGVVTKADITSWIPFFEGAFLPAVCLEDAVRYRARYTVRLGSGDEIQNLNLRVNASKRGAAWFPIPREWSQVTIASTRFKVFGFTLPFTRNRLVA